jgi:hypothetical protein
MGSARPVVVDAGGHDYVAAAELAKQRLDVRRVFDVVEDQQPAVVCLEPADCPFGRVRGCPRQRDLRPQPARQRGQARLYLTWVYGGDPPGQAMVSAMPTRVLQGQLGLADAAKAVNDLGHHGPAALIER